MGNAVFFSLQSACVCVYVSQGGLWVDAYFKPCLTLFNLCNTFNMCEYYVHMVQPCLKCVVFVTNLMWFCEWEFMNMQVSFSVFCLCVCVCVAFLPCTRLFVWPTPLSWPLIGIHSRLIIQTAVGGYGKQATTQAPTEIPLTANELFPSYICPSFYRHAHTHNTCVPESHFLTIFLMAQPSAGYTYRLVAALEHFPLLQQRNGAPTGLLGRGAKPRDITVMEGLRGINAMWADVLSRDTITAIWLQVRLPAS